MPPVSTTQAAKLFPLFAAGINDTGGKFATSFASVVDTGGKFATGVNDTGGNFISFLVIFCVIIILIFGLTPVANNGNNIRLLRP